MLALNDLEAWLVANGVSNPVINRLPDTPDQAVAFNVGPGLSETFDGAFVPVHVQIRSRGNKDDDASAEAIANGVHNLMRAHPGSFLMGTTYVLSIEPQGVPTYYGRDVDLRTTYIATYLFTVAA